LQGALAHAKNDDGLLKRKISCSQWESPNILSRCLFFFLLCFGVGGGGKKDFFSFFPTSQCVCTMFLSSAQWVSNIFPNIFSIPLHFYMRRKMVSSFPLYRWAKGEEFEPSVLGSLHYLFIFGMMSQSNWHVAPKKKLGKHFI